MRYYTELGHLAWYPLKIKPTTGQSAYLCNTWLLSLGPCGITAPPFFSGLLYSEPIFVLPYDSPFSQALLVFHDTDQSLIGKKLPIYYLQNTNSCLCRRRPTWFILQLTYTLLFRFLGKLWFIRPNTYRWLGCILNAPQWYSNHQPQPVKRP